MAPSQTALRWALVKSRKRDLCLRAAGPCGFAWLSSPAWGRAPHSRVSNEPHWQGWWLVRPEGHPQCPLLPDILPWSPRCSQVASTTSLTPSPSPVSDG